MLKTRWSKTLVILLALCSWSGQPHLRRCRTRNSTVPRRNQTYYMCTFVIGRRVLGRGFRGLQGCREADGRQGRLPGHD